MLDLTSWYKPKVVRYRARLCDPSTSLERHVDGMLRYPGLAKHDILWVYTNYHRLVVLETELVTLRAETEKYRKKLSTLQLSYEQECLSARSASSALANVEDMNARVRRLADLESKKARKAADERDKERLRVRHLKRLVTELEKDARNARGDGRGGEVLSAIRKLAKSPAVGKRLAAACHPDKAPPELNGRSRALPIGTRYEMIPAHAHVCF